MSRTGHGLLHPQSGTHARGRGPWHCNGVSQVQGNHHYHHHNHHHQQERGRGAPCLVGVETAITTRAVSECSAILRQPPSTPPPHTYLRRQLLLTSQMRCLVVAPAGVLGWFPRTKAGASRGSNCVTSLSH